MAIDSIPESVQSSSCVDSCRSGSEASGKTGSFGKRAVKWMMDNGPSLALAATAMALVATNPVGLTVVAVCLVSVCLFDRNITTYAESQAASQHDEKGKDGNEPSNDSSNKLSFSGGAGKGDQDEDPSVPLKEDSISKSYRHRNEEEARVSALIKQLDNLPAPSKSDSINKSHRQRNEEAHVSPLIKQLDDLPIPTSMQLTERDDTRKQNPSKSERRQEMMTLLADHIVIRDGKSTKIPSQVADDNGEMRDLFQYTGLVFRSDTRTMQDLINDGGFNSQNDLREERNLQEALGIRSDGRGATGQSGVSCASDMEGAYEYGCFDDENNRTRMFVIDTSLIGNETAYDMSAIVTNNNGFGADNTGNEVNLTSAPTRAIVGYIEFSPELTSYQAPTFTANPAYRQ